MTTSKPIMNYIRFSLTNLAILIVCAMSLTAEESDNKESKRRALPAPFASPPFPSAEYQGYPLIGVPPSDTVSINASFL